MLNFHTISIHCSASRSCGGSRGSPLDSRGGTVHVFVPNHHGTGISVRCMRPYDEYRQFPPNPEGGARSNATLFDNRQQKNSECQRWHKGGRADVWLTVFSFDKVPTGWQVSNAGTDVFCVCVCVCVCVCACAPAQSLQLFPYTSRINFKHLLSY